MVKDLIGAEGGLNLSKMEDWLPDDLKKKIVAIMPPCLDATNDQFRVASEEDGTSTVKALYHNQRRSDTRPIDNCWKSIWNLKVVE